jgi:precorrin-6B methylase 2
VQYDNYKKTCEDVLTERDKLVSKLMKLKTTVHKLEHVNKILKNQIIEVEINPNDEVSKVLQFRSNNSTN